MKVRPTEAYVRLKDHGKPNAVSLDPNKVYEARCVFPLPNTPNRHRVMIEVEGVTFLLDDIDYEVVKD